MSHCLYKVQMFGQVCIEKQSCSESSATIDNSIVTAGKKVHSRVLKI